MTACLRFTQRVWKSFLENCGHDARCFPNLQIQRAVPGTIECTLQTVHGGLILSLVDTVGSLAVASKGHFMTGVSVDINGSFLRPAGIAGDTLHVRGRVVGFGKTLAYTRIDVEDSAGKLVAYGSHTKYIASIIGRADNVKFLENGDQVIEGS
ncbi:Thioesterase/thiol ester dehydrase-isomerase [Cantharellus anzutake]|uniref:Thioesterase/thiol ester dehydrase-isomerase n=1 Tax=Cantharellus anzutake TaxID=1750568 RepID=UPI001908C317|nr:Thioesterase/thiol ester dehydrase-isomerase [Cantharellus anzutake]KAF8333552.1 Thioesterase/thiol ester dehydrase-isomerase [Cantharellus anzutake]